MASAAQYGIKELIGYERAHSQGAGFGAESGAAIRLAPRLVNQILQNRGVEQFIRDLREVVPPEAILLLTTVTKTHSGTLRLGEIDYQLEGKIDSRSAVLFAASIEVKLDGRARAGARLPGSDEYSWGPWTSK